MEQSLIVTSDPSASQEESVIASPEFLTLLNTLGLVQHDRPLLLQDFLLDTKVGVEMRADIMDVYSVEPIGFGAVTNMTLPVWGATIYEFEPHLGKDQVWHNRYFQVRLLVEVDGEVKVVKSGSSQLLRHVAFLCEKYGWFLFDDGPIEYRFVHRGPGQPHYLDRKDKKVRKLLHDKG